MVKKKFGKKSKKNIKMRQFTSGATRHTNEDKLSYIKALSSLVLKRYTQYIGQHRTQADGNIRSWDNWKNGIPIDVYMDSKGRHFMDAWLHHDGYPEEAEYDNVEDVLCAELFNTMGFLHELLVKKKKFK